MTLKVPEIVLVSRKFYGTLLLPMLLIVDIVFPMRLDETILTLCKYTADTFVKFTKVV